MAKTKTDVLRIKLESTGDGRVSASLAETEKGFVRIENQARKTEGSVFSLRNALAGIGVAAIARSTIQTIVQFEKLQASLRTVTGSAEAAGQAFDALKQFATETPFQLDEIVDGFIKLKALGLQPSEEALRSYGNTASAMGKSLNQFIEAVADAATGEFERLKEFGIKASQQGDEVSFTFQGVTTTVQKNASAIEGYLRKIGNTEFAGAMNEQMKTLGGAFSNLQDASSQLAAAIGGAGLSDLLKDAAGAVRFFAEELTKLVSSDTTAKMNNLERGLVGFGATTAYIFRTAGANLGAAAAAIGALYEDGFDAAKRVWDARSADFIKEMEEFGTKFKNIFSGIGDIGKKPSLSGGNGNGGNDDQQSEQALKFYELLGAIEKQNRAIRANIEGWSDQEEQTRAVEDATKKLGKALTDEQTTAIRAAVREQQKLNKELEASQKAARDAESQAQDLGYTFTSAFEDAALSGENLRGVLQGLAKDLARIALRKTVTEPLGNAAGSFFAGLFHTGGIAGDGGNGRAVSPLVFAGARRYHTGGIAGDEVPAILRRGEEVLTRDDPRHRYNQGGGAGDVTIVQHIDARGSSPGMESALAAAAEQGARQGYLRVLEDAKRNGPIRRELQA